MPLPEPAVIFLCGLNRLDDSVGRRVVRLRVDFGPRPLCRGPVHLLRVGRVEAVKPFGLLRREDPGFTPGSFRFVVLLRRGLRYGRWRFLRLCGRCGLLCRAFRPAAGKVIDRRLRRCCGALGVKLAEVLKEGLYPNDAAALPQLLVHLAHGGERVQDGLRRFGCNSGDGE